MVPIWIHTHVCIVTGADGSVSGGLESARARLSIGVASGGAQEVCLLRASGMSATVVFLRVLSHFSAFLCPVVNHWCARIEYAGA